MMETTLIQKKSFISEYRTAIPENLDEDTEYL